MSCPRCGDDRATQGGTCPTCGLSIPPPTAQAPFAEATIVSPLLPQGRSPVGVEATRVSSPGAPDPASTGARAASEGSGPLTPGQAFGPRYHVIRMIGMGGMGAIYQVWDSELELALALKVVRPDVTDDPALSAEIERRFKQELLLARLVTHPNVVRIHDLGEIDGIKFITMPYIEGVDLAAILEKQGTQSVPWVLRVARQVAAGLSAAHAAGIVHRDLKPANIMIDANDNALIMDFGIARANVDPGGARMGAGGAMAASARAGATSAGAIVGTLEYMAPEQARGERVDARADIYAFGLILHHMLVGKRLMPGATDAFSDVMARTHAEPTRLREIDLSIPEAVEALVSKCVQPDSKERFQTSGELAAALDDLDDEGNPKPKPKHLARTWRFWAVTSAVTLVLVTSTWWFAQRFVSRIPPPAKDPIAVLVADFVNTTGDQVFDGLLEPALGVGIEGASFITAYQRPAALRVARQIKAGDRLTEQAARLVAMREGVKIVLSGTIEKRGNGFGMSVRGVDPTSGTVLLSTAADASGRDDVLAAAGKLSAGVRKALGDTKAAEAKETLSAASVDAVVDYLKAQALSVAGRDEEAIPFYKRATERDPDFGRAWGGWATAATRLGRKDEADRLWKKALGQLDHMTERERYRMLGVYYTLVTRSYDKALDTFTTLVNQFPADSAGHNNLAVAYFRRLDFKKALEEGGRVLKVFPMSPLYRTNHALYAMYAGDFDAASAEAQKLVDDKSASYDAYLPIAMAAIARGDLAGAQKAYTEMAKAGAEGRSLSVVGLADLALYQGNPAGAADLLTAGIAADKQADNPAGVITKQMILAEALEGQGRLGPAVEQVRQAIRGDQSEAVVVPAARILLAAHRDAEAERLGSDLANKLEPQSRAYGQIIAGMAARARGRRVESVDEYRKAIALADLWLARFGLGLAYLDANYYAEALSEFDACIKRRGEASAAFLDDVPTARLVAPLPYWIGRSQEGLGLLPQARENYKTFLATSAPDSADPLVKDARRRLAEK